MTDEDRRPRLEGHSWRLEVPLSKVHVFSDYACPWCYLGLSRLQTAIGDREIEVEIVHFPLSPDTPPEGRDIRAYLEDKGIDVDAAWLRLKGLLDAEGLPWPDQAGGRASNTRLAQELASWAVTQPGGDAIHAALFDAYQVQRRNLADAEVLVEVAASVGLDPDAARAVLSERTHRAVVDEHWSAARASGVTGVPTFAAGGRGVVGAQPVEVLTRLLDAAE